MDVSNKVASLIQQSEEFSVVIWFARAIGGRHGVQVKLSEQDRSMIDAAFRLCIS